MERYRPHWLVALTVAATFAAGWAPVSCVADPIPCDDAGFWVDTPDQSTRDMVCEAASTAQQALNECDLHPTEAITIDVVDNPIHTMGQCLAAFDCELGRIKIIDPNLLRDHLRPEDAYAALPDDVVFRSLLTHQAAHALVAQISGDLLIAPVDHEYIASALELSALEPADRQTLLNIVGIEPPISSGVIDIFIYGLAPRRFAAASYLYF